MGQNQVRISDSSRSSIVRSLNITSCLPKGSKIDTDQCEYIDISKAKEIDTMSKKGGSGLTINSTVPPYMNSVSIGYMEPWDALEKDFQNTIEVKNCKSSRSSASYTTSNAFLSQCVWYVGSETRNNSESKLKDAPLYSFVVRLSSDNIYHLIIKYQFGFIHLRIREENGTYTLEICRNKSFYSITDLVSHFQKFPLDINNVGKITLLRNFA